MCHRLKTLFNLTNRPLLIAWPSKLSFGGTVLALLELSLPSNKNNNNKGHWVPIPPCSHGFIALLQIGFITGEESFVGFVKENLKREQETGMKALRFSDENRDKALCSQKETGCRFLM